MKTARIARLTLFGIAAAFIIGCAHSSASAPAPRVGSTSTGKGVSSSMQSSLNDRADIVVAVKAAAAKDCGCGSCAAKGCAPCKGKNCYYCAAKALVETECGCGMCDAKGCEMCGPGCDVCKFHLAPNAEATSPQKQ